MHVDRASAAAPIRAIAIIVSVAPVWQFRDVRLSRRASAGGVRGERRYVDVGEFVAANLPRNAALFSSQHSGSLRFYTGATRSRTIR